MEELIFRCKHFRQEISRTPVIRAGSELHLMMHEFAQRALRLTAELNALYYPPEELIGLMEQLIQRPIGSSFTLFPPFYTNCGINIKIGDRVFINSGCHFQDQAGIILEDDVLIGHNTVITTLNHESVPERRADLLPAAVHIEQQVWIGANVTICPGVRIGRGAIVAAGAVVTKDVAPGTLVGGVPAKILRR